MVHLRILSFVPVLFLGRMIVSVDQGSYLRHLISDWIWVPGYFVFMAWGGVLFPSGSSLGYDGLCKVSWSPFSFCKPRGPIKEASGPVFHWESFPNL